MKWKDLLVAVAFFSIAAGAPLLQQRVPYPDWVEWAFTFWFGLCGILCLFTPIVFHMDQPVEKCTSCGESLPEKDDPAFDAQRILCPKCYRRWKAGITSGGILWEIIMGAVFASLFLALCLVPGYVYHTVFGEGGKSLLKLVSEAVIGGCAVSLLVATLWFRRT